MSDELSIKVSRVREAAAKDPDVNEVLRTLFPEAFGAELKIGDVVVGIRLVDNHFPTMGQLGMVLLPLGNSYHSREYGVQFFEEGADCHELGGRGLSRHCLWCKPDDIELVMKRADYYDRI